MYKILAKILAGRLRRILERLIANVQSAFIPNRNILDGVAIINEVVDFAKKERKRCMILKVDFERAYDSINWGFLDYMMRKFGMDEKWRKWIKVCVCCGNLSMLVNGSPMEEVNIQK